MDWCEGCVNECVCFCFVLCFVVDMIRGEGWYDGWDGVEEGVGCCRVVLMWCGYGLWLVVDGVVFCIVVEYRFWVGILKIWLMDRF